MKRFAFALGVGALIIAFAGEASAQGRSYGSRGNQSYSRGYGPSRGYNYNRGYGSPRNYGYNRGSYYGGSRYNSSRGSSFYRAPVQYRPRCVSPYYNAPRSGFGFSTGNFSIYLRR